MDEVVDLLLEVWSEELIDGGEVNLPDIGRLSIEVQDMTAGGALAAHGRLRRVYGRFRPTPSLKAKIEEVTWFVVKLLKVMIRFKTFLLKKT